MWEEQGGGTSGTSGPLVVRLGREVQCVWEGAHDGAGVEGAVSVRPFELGLGV